MKTRTILLTLASCFVAGAVCFASDLQMGTWKLNEAKSKLAPGMPKNNTVVYEAAGDNVKVTVDGTDNDGKPAHNEWTGKFDGKDYAVTSKGYNLSSDGSCNFNAPGDVNNTSPMLGPLQWNGGPTKTMALPSGSPAIDAGNPSGCTDGQGHLLKTDQRAKPRPDTEDTGGCDMGAFERQRD